MGNYAILPQIVVSDALTFDFVDDVGAATATLAAGTYDDIIAFCVALETALDAGSDLSGDDNFTVSVGSTGTISISHDGTVLSLLWDTDTNGDMATFASILGFSTAADDTAALSTPQDGLDSGTPYTSDYQHDYGWYAPRAPAYDSWDYPVVDGPDPYMSWSGKVSRTSNPATIERRVLRWELIADTKYHPDYADTNEDFISTYKKIAAGSAFNLYSDISVPTLDGTYWLIEPSGALVTDRHSSEIAYFNFDLTFQKDNT